MTVWHDPQKTQPNSRPQLPTDEPTRLHAQPAVEIVSHVPTRSRPQREKRKLPAGLFLGLPIGLFLIALVGVASLFGLYELNGWTYPGTQVGMVNVSRLTPTEATFVLAAAWETDSAITLTDGEQTWQANPTTFGLTIDAAATIERIERGFVPFITGITVGNTIEPVITINAARAEATLNEWAVSTINTEPQNASIRLEGTRVIPVEGQPGTMLDVPTTLDILTRNPGRALQSGQIPLVTEPVAPAINDVTPYVEQAEAMLAEPLTISAYDPIANERLEAEIASNEVATWLTITETDAGPQIDLQPVDISTTLNQLDSQLGDARRIDGEVNQAALLAALHGNHHATVSVSYQPTTYTVVAGDTVYRIAWKTGIPYWRIVEANPGIDQRGLSVGDVVTIPAKTDLIPLPVVEGKRVEVSISQQRMWVYENGEVIREFIISTGIEDSPTQPGIFQMQTFDDWAYASNWDLYMPEFIGIYEAWPGFMNGFHGLPTLSNGNILWGNILGSPASYGCIILDLDDSQWLWDWSEEGIIVEITE